METPTVGGYLADTQKAIWQRKNGCSWRELARTIDVPHGVLHALGNGKWGHVSWDTVRIVRRHMGLFDPGPIVETFACPDCDESEPHAARCHGKPVAAVVCLAPDETVRPVAKRRRSRATVGIGGLHPDVRAAHDARRNGKTWNQYLADMLQEPQP